MAATWRNWSGSERAECVTVHPRGAGEIAEILALNRDDGQRVRPVGSSHSGSGIARPRDVQLALDRHADLVRLDTATGLVTVQAGMTLRRLNLLLAEAGLGLTNLGDIDAQTVAGAMATGTHGTGARFGGLATQLRGLELVTPSGELITCSAYERPEVFGPARIGLGALGVVSTLTLQAEPAFALRADERPMPLAEVLARFEEFAEETDHFEFYWFPHTDTALVWRRNRVPLSETDPLPAWRAWWDDEFLTNTVFGATVALGRRVPPSVPAVNRFCARALGARTYTDRSDRVFTATRRVRWRSWIPLRGRLARSVPTFPEFRSGKNPDVFVGARPYRRSLETGQGEGKRSWRCRHRTRRSGHGGWSRRTGPRGRSTASTSTCPRGGCWACSAPTGRGRPPRCAS